MAKRTWTDEQLIVAVPTACNLKEAIEALGLIATGGNYLTVRKRIEALGLDCSHFEWSQTVAGANNRNRYSLDQILVVDSPFTNSWDLRKRLVKDGLLKEECSRCGLTEWLGQSITLELDHVNGERTDNRIENLRILCPNCHSLTPTYRGKKNAGKKRKLHGSKG